MAAPATGMAGLFGGAGPTAYVNSLYGPIQAQLARQQQARVGTLNDLVGSILASLKAPQPDVYGAAAQDQTAAANGAAQTLARVNPDAQTQAMLRAIGAPQSQQDQVGAQNNVTFNGQGALGQYVGGALPAGVFAQDQAARNTYLQSLPATVGLSAIQGLGHLNLLASQENSKLASDKAGAQQKALSDLAAYVQKNQGLKMQAQKTAFDQNLATAKYKTGVNEFNARQSLDYQKLARSSFQSDRSYQVSLAGLGIRQANLQLKITQNAFKAAHGGYGPQQIKKFNLQANAIANAAYHGTTATTVDKNGNPTTTTKGSGQPYFQALGTMMKKGVPVQNALDALDRVYPANLRPTEAALQKELGPLTPAAIMQSLSQGAQQGGAAIGDAASYGFSPGKTGRVTIAPGADRPGVPTVPIVKSFVASLAGALGMPLTIGTGSRHNEMTTDGNVSDHWSGHAADVPLTGAALTRAGRQALILAGMPPAQAMQQTGGLFDLNVGGHRVQIIFNSMQGGNHFNHLHVGIR